jgi:formylglycine-generating enzyme required for sulfatase activity
LVVVLSEHSNRSAHVRSEVERAFNGGVQIVPFRIDEGELSPELQYFLSTVQWLDAWDGPMDRHLSRLTGVVKDYLAGVRPGGAGRRTNLRETLGPRAWWAAGLLLLVAGGGIAVYLWMRPTAPEVRAPLPPVPVPPVKSLPETWVNPKDGETYVWIPAGRFLMGCSASDTECDDDEKPAHWVMIAKGFWLGRTEVTVRAFSAYARKAGLPAPTGDENFPVVDVDWARAREYCKAVGGRLPTEAEWEYAARSGRPEATYDALPRIARYNENSGDHLHPVGQKQPNAYGLYDMLGNVFEWTLDRYYNRYYEQEGEGEPELPLAGNASGVLRGGSWAHDRKAARVSNRFGAPPDMAEPIAGFRCAADVK